MKDHVTSMEWKPKEISQFRFGQDHYKRIVTKQNHVHWYKLTSLYTWRLIDSPIVFGKLEEQRRNLLNG